jgi:hypothetical protein
LLKELCFGWILVAVGVDCYIATYGWFFYYQSWRWIPPIAIGVYIVATFLYALIYFFSEVEEFDDLD